MLGAGRLMLFYEANKLRVQLISLINFGSVCM